MPKRFVLKLVRRSGLCSRYERTANSTRWRIPSSPRIPVLFGFFSVVVFTLIQTLHI